MRKENIYMSDDLKLFRTKKELNEYEESKKKPAPALRVPFYVSEEEVDYLITNCMNKDLLKRLNCFKQKAFRK